MYLLIKGRFSSHIITESERDKMYPKVTDTTDTSGGNIYPFNPFGIFARR